PGPGRRPRRHPLVAPPGIGAARPRAGREIRRFCAARGLSLTGHAVSRNSVRPGHAGTDRPRAPRSPRKSRGEENARIRARTGRGWRLPPSRRSYPFPVVRPTTPERRLVMFLSSWLRSRHPSDAGRRGRARVKPGGFRPRLEALEGRDVPSTLTVTNNLDSGKGSLRYEIAHAGKNSTIDFAPSLDGKTITLTSGELDITQGLTIQGPGAGQLTI